jgi:hypothetical protein
MTFASPAFLAALGLLVPVLVAFLVKRRREVIRVPSVLLYRLAGAPTTQNRRFRNVKRLAALLACLAGVAALVLAAARPSAGSRGETVAFVIDVSGSMEAGGRDAPLAKARKFAAQMIASGGPGDRYAIVAAGATPVRLAGPSAAGPDLDEALAHLAVERGAADLEAGIELAAALVAPEPAARIVVIGDGGESAGGLLAVREVPVLRKTFAPPARDNLGIAAFATRPPADAKNEEEREAVVTVATSSDRPRVARVTVTADGQEIAKRRVDVPPRGEAEVRLRVVAAARRIVARVDPEDGAADALASDDEAVITAAARPEARALLVATDDEAATAAAFFVEKALTAAGVRHVVRVPPDLSGVAPGPGDVLIALNQGPSRAPGVPAIYLGTHAGVLPFSGLVELEGDKTHLRSLETNDPLLRGVALDGVTIEHATAAITPVGARPLVDLDGGTVVIAGGAGSNAFVYIGVDPAKSDLVLRVAFPVLVANAVHALGGAVDVAVADTVARSEIALREAPAEAGAGAIEPDARWRIPVGPAAFLALVGAILLSLEAWAWRKGWAS